MTQAELETMLIGVVREIQRISGREAVPVSADTKPVTDMPGFDSLNGVEATVDVMDKLKIELEFNNVFVKDTTPLTVRDAAKRLLGCIKKG